MQKKLLIIEDEIVVREELAILLKNSDYDVEALDSFNNVVEQIKEIEPNLILLDVNLPGLNGYRLCSRIRSFSDVPIIFITGRNTSSDELQALTLGGDDFIVKPYDSLILLARINLILKRSSTNESIKYKDIELLIGKAVIKFQHECIDLTKTELKILFLLFSNPNNFISRNEIIEYLWDNEIYIDDNTLSVNINRIREKLKSIGLLNFITTKRGMGYKI